MGKLFQLLEVEILLILRLKMEELHIIDSVPISQGVHFIQSAFFFKFLSLFPTILLSMYVCLSAVHFNSNLYVWPSFRPLEIQRRRRSKVSFYAGDEYKGPIAIQFHSYSFQLELLRLKDILSWKKSPCYTSVFENEQRRVIIELCVLSL